MSLFIRFVDGICSESCMVCYLLSSVFNVHAGDSCIWENLLPNFHAAEQLISHHSWFHTSYGGAESQILIHRIWKFASVILRMAYSCAKAIVSTFDFKHSRSYQGALAEMQFELAQKGKWQ